SMWGPASAGPPGTFARAWCRTCQGGRDMRPRFSTLVSVVVHTVVIGAAVCWSVVAPGTLPSPRDMLAYTEILPIEVPKVPPPPQRAVPSTSPTPTSPALAPIAMPNGIPPETGRENAATSNVPSDVVGVISGLPGGLGGSEVVVPPPPPRAPEKPAEPVH